MITDNEDKGTFPLVVSEPRYHHYDIYGRYAHSSDVANDRCTEVRPPAFTPHYNWNDAEWIYAPDIALHPSGVELLTLPKSK